MYMEGLRLYNTLTREKERFNPLRKGHATVYACGPTVYDYAHLGNLRNYVFNDLLHRALKAEGYKTDFIINITDVGHLTDDADQGEDKLEKKSREEKRDIWEIASYYEEVFKHDLKALNVLPATKWPRATDHIEEQIALIQRIEENGYAYMTSDGLYFDTSKLDEYGELVPNFDPESLDAGHRVAMKEKKNPTDFALWKLSGDANRQMEWESPWGAGFPGWHIECTAMGCKYLGETFDIHTGGVDHISVHHTNELAQARGAHGEPHAQVWMHGEFLNLEDGKMSKSKGDFLRLKTIQDKGYDPLDFRYLCLLTHYRKPLRFTWDALDAARTARLRLQQKTSSIVKAHGDVLTDSVKHRLLRGPRDDLNYSELLAELRDVLKSDMRGEEKAGAILFADSLLGLDLSSSFSVPRHVQELVEKRGELREKQQYAAADKIREEVRERGFEIKDGEDGYDVIPRRIPQR